MAAGPISKHKVVLKDYSYQDDIALRLLMSDLTVLEVEVLKEALSHSLSFPLADLLSFLDHDEETVRAALDRLARTRVVRCQGDVVTVDKDLRKYYEVHIEKFEENTPGFDYLFALLRRVPIQVLPAWYAVPRSSDDILRSIAEHYLATPKVYERHLTEAVSADPLLKAIAQDLFASSNLKLLGADVRKQHKLSREKFHEVLLLLEYNLVACLGYERSGDGWDEIVTPFREWREYLFHKRLATSSPVEVDEVRTRCDSEFTFVKDLTALLRAMEQAPLALAGDTLTPASIAQWLPELQKRSVVSVPDYTKILVSRLLDLDIAVVSNGALYATSEAKEWCRKSHQDQAVLVYRLPYEEAKFPERSLRDVERSLRTVIGRGWVYFDEFVKSLLIPLGQAQAVTLKQTGKRWRYEIPQYSADEIAFVRWVILQRLFEAGMVAIGLHKGRECFCVTAFGRLALGD